MIKLFHDRFRWVLIGWMFVISATAYLDRVNISVAGQFIQKDLNLNSTQLGWVFSAFVLGYALFQAPAGRIADRFGPRLVIVLGTLWWGVFTALTASVTKSLTAALGVLLVIRFALGMGESVVYPASNCLVARWVPGPERGIANGWMFAGVGAGAGVAPPLITYIVIHYGWRWSFWTSAVLGVVVGLVWYWLCRDRPRDHPMVSEAENRHIAAGLGPPSSHRSVSWRVILGNGDLRLVTLSYFCYGYSAYIFFTWFFIYLSKVRGLDLKASSYYAMLPFMAMAICSPLGGWMSDRLCLSFGKRVGRCGIAVFGMGLCGVFIAFGTYVRDARLASIVLAGGAGALYISQSVFWSVTADLAGEAAGSASGMMNMGNQIGGTITASLTPYLANELGWTASFLVAAGLCVCGALLWLRVNPYGQLLELEPEKSEVAQL